MDYAVDIGSFTISPDFSRQMDPPGLKMWKRWAHS